MNLPNTIQELRDVDVNDIRDVFDYTDRDFAVITDLRHLQESELLRFNCAFIIIVKTGRISLDLNSRSYTLEHGQLLIANRYTLVGNYMMSPDFDGAVIMISSRMVNRLMQHGNTILRRLFFVLRNPVLTLLEEEKEIFWNFNSLLKRLFESQLNYRQQAVTASLQSLLYAVCSCIERDLPQQDRPERGRGEALFRQFIHLLASSPVCARNIQYYADQLFISTKYLSTICHSYCGQTAKQLIDDHVAANVEFMLLHTDKSMKEIANELGFPNLSYFGTYCRRKFRMSPTAYREQKKSDASA